MELQAFSSQELEMLELLATGTGNEAIAQRMGLKYGTTRVYIHNLYSKLGVQNRTSAVARYLEKKAQSDGSCGSRFSGEALMSAGAQVNSLHAFVERHDLLGTLGVLSIFLGGHSRLWETASKLKAVSFTPELLKRQRRSRQVWEAWFRGDFLFAKQLYDNGEFPELVVSSPTDALALACMLHIGGYSAIASDAGARLAPKRERVVKLSLVEKKLLAAVAAAASPKRDLAAIKGLESIALERTSSPPVRQMALVSLYGVRSLERNREAQAAIARSLVREAESVMNHLRELGEDPFCGGQPLVKATPTNHEPESLRKSEKRQRKVAA